MTVSFSGRTLLYGVN